MELTGSQDYLNKVPNFQGSKVQDYYDKYKRSSITLDDNAFLSLLSATIRPIQKRVGFVDLGETIVIMVVGILVGGKYPLDTLDNTGD